MGEQIADVSPAPSPAGKGAAAKGAEASRPPTWAFVLAFAIVYLAYGLNYLAIREGVQTLPPFLFAGAHVTLAGLLVFTWAALRGEQLRLSGRNFLWAAAGGLVVFIGGTGLVTMAEKQVNSGVASILRATTPVWVALLEWLRPKGERLSAAAWGGFLLAIGGVLVVVIPDIDAANRFSQDAAPLLVLASALSWAVGAIILRHHRPCASNLVATAYQMTVGGVAMVLLGLVLGEGPQFNPAELTHDALLAFLFLLLVHSLAGFSALNWLLQHVPASLATTKFYVSPAVAIVAGSLVLREKDLTPEMLGGMALILTGVALALWKR
jgi:drug/metabolite transporter (DMT)-like permease